MFRALLQLSGIERRLQDYRERIEGRAERLIQQGKAVAMQLAVAAALATGAIVILILAFIAGLLVLYLWLEPRLGSLAATGVVGGALTVLAAALAFAAFTVGRRQPPAPQPLRQAPSDAAAADAAAADAVAAAAAAAARNAAADAAFAAPPRPITSTEVDALLALTRRFTRLPEVGVEPLDALLKGLTPRAEEAGKEAVARAAALVRDGDRTTMLTILGAAAAAGWILTRAHLPEPKAAK
jgi:hypothetical protein